MGQLPLFSLPPPPPPPGALRSGSHPAGSSALWVCGFCSMVLWVSAPLLCTIYFDLSFLLGFASCPSSCPALRTSAWEVRGSRDTLAGKDAGLLPWPDLRMLLMVQIWESMVSSGPQKEVTGQGEQQVSLWEQGKAGDCTHSPHCKPLNLRFTPRIGVTGADYVLGASRLAWEPWILGSFSVLLGRYQVHFCCCR